VSKTPSFKEFMDQVETRLESFSPDVWREILLQWAKDTQPAERDGFLARLVRPSPDREIPKSDENLIEEIADLAIRVENGAYVDGWGWDDAIHEERDWGDESWAEEVDEFFNRAHAALASGQHQLAREAYSRLFDILDQGEEPGHLPGNPDAQSMLGIDLNEAQSSYLRSIYLSSPHPERPGDLLQAIQRFWYQHKGELNLTSVVNVESAPLPDWGQFLPEWIDFLKETRSPATSYLLREAVFMFGGTAALAEFARSESNRFPRAYIDWIQTLEKEDNTQAMLQAAREGLANVPRGLVVRAEIAQGLVRAGERLQDPEMQLAGWKEAFYSNPSISVLLSLLSAAEPRGGYQVEITAAINRVSSLLARENQNLGRSYIDKGELTESSASVDLLYQAYLLAGRYDDAYNLNNSPERGQWNYRNIPVELGIAFFLKLLSRKKRQPPTPNQEQLWNEAFNHLEGYHTPTDVIERFEMAIEKVIQSSQISEEAEKKYLSWLKKTIAKYVDSTVGEKLRDGYNKAAIQLVALAEVLALSGQKSEGTGLIETYTQKYRNFSAFRREMNTATGRSRIFSPASTDRTV
jgi:hypothetical protein